MHRTPMAIVLITTLALTGCADRPVDLDASTYALTAAGIPATILVGEEFTFQVTAAGPHGHTDHVGAHHWAGSQSEPGMVFGDSLACTHLDAMMGDGMDGMGHGSEDHGHTGEGPIDVVGTHDVTCVFTEPGVRYLRGHLRITDHDETFDYFAAEQRVVVAPDYTLRFEGLPATGMTGTAYEATLNITGDAWSSPHLGAHHWNAVQTDPKAALSSAAACDHQSGELPGEFIVSCTFDQSGTRHVYGHLRVTVGGMDFDYWAPPVQIDV